MSQAHQASDDLQYVRQAVFRREQSRGIPVSIAWMVAVYVVVGYTMLDFNPRWASLFFAVGGLAMGVLGWIFGKHNSHISGEYDRDEVRKSMLHWLSILLAIAGVIALSIARHLPGQVVGQFIALTIGLIYFLGGVHFDRNLLWLGPLLMAGAVAITYVPHYGWTALGLLVGLGLVVPTWFRNKTPAAV
jgi:H+/Cl- antiporter ClcA